VADPDETRRGADERARGLAYALAAYLTWGGMAVYIKALAPVPPLEILAHRVAWSVVFLFGLLVARRRLGLLAHAREVPWHLAASTLLIAANWLVFIWAVGAGRLLEASLGYYVNPLVNVLLGVLFLGERLSRRQLAAVALAGAGVAAMVLRLGGLPWVALALALSFGLYGLVRKRSGLDAAAGLLAETALLAPPAVAYLALLAARGSGAFGREAGQSLLLAAAGVITAVPLVWFALGVQRLRLSTLGLVQYLSPTVQFLLAVLLYGEPFTAAHAAAFGCIWAGLALFSWDALRPRAPA
jgi:chloramphenicol-sensitive protein RarD